MTRTHRVGAAAVLLDMDGTLVDSTAVVESMWTSFSDEHGLDASEVIAFAHGRQTIDTVRRFLPARTDHETIAGRFLAAEVDWVDGVVEVPGAARFVRELDGFRFAVVTSAPRTLAVTRLRAAGIEPPDVLVPAEDASEGKPSPRGYLLAAERLGVDPGDCVVFEDAEAGLLAAVASGARTVVVGGHESATTAALPRIPDFSEVQVQHDGSHDISIEWPSGTTRP